MSRWSLARTYDQNTALTFVAIKYAKTGSSLFGQILQIKINVSSAYTSNKCNMYLSLSCNRTVILVIVIKYTEAVKYD